MIDPPSVNIGEYLPFRWNLEQDRSINLVPNCNQSQANRTNILLSTSRTSSSDPICHFVLRNGAGEASTFSRYCFDKTDLKQYPLFDSYFATRSVSDQSYQRSVMGW